MDSEAQGTDLETIAITTTQTPPKPKRVKKKKTITRKKLYKNLTKQLLAIKYEHIKRKKEYDQLGEDRRKTESELNREIIQKLKPIDDQLTDICRHILVLGRQEEMINTMLFCPHRNKKITENEPCLKCESLLNELMDVIIK
jgi:hypothetical protein